MKSRAERLQEFINRLEAAPPAASHDEAFQLLSEALNAVEDEHSGVPYDPTKYLSDGRLYPPQEDSRRSVPERPDLVRYRSAKHNTYIHTSGAIVIVSVPKPGILPVLILSKPGADGAFLELPK